MNLSDFPRPHHDTGRGVHWSGSPYPYLKEWAFWKDQLQQMHVRWVKMLDDSGGSGLPLARRLVDIGVMPVVRMFRNQQNPGTIGSRGADAVRAYLEECVPYYEVNNEPDLALEWKNGIRPENWLDIVVGNFVADADVILELGGYPAVPAFGVGTLRDPFQKIVDLGRKDILDGGAWAAIHNYCLGRPLEYPNDDVNMFGTSITQEEWETAGGLWAWEMGPETVNEHRRKLANPDANILEDATCFRAYEQLNEYVVRACGHSIPIMMTEGGYNVGQRAGTYEGDDPRYPKPTPQRCSELNHDMFRFVSGETTLLGQRVPDYLFAVMPWLIAAERLCWYAPPAENQGPWYTHKYDAEWGLSGELRLVQMLRDDPGTPRADGPVPMGWDWKRDSDALGEAWDDRLDYLRVTYCPYHHPHQPHWRLIRAEWRDETESQGLPAIFVKAIGAEGNPIEFEDFRVYGIHGESEFLLQTKGALDDYWGNFPMYSGGLGELAVEMEHGASDAVMGMGLGLEDNRQSWAATQFWLTFQWTPGDDQPRDRRDPYWRGR